MKIFIGADHRGFKLKNKIAVLLKKRGHTVLDVGTYDEEVSCDYPPLAFDVARRVAKTKGSRGILVCMTGIGHSIAANKIPGAYAALCYNQQAAQLSRQHNDANILILGSKFVPARNISKIVNVWLAAKFEGGRHLRRVNQIKAIEKNICCTK